MLKAPQSWNIAISSALVSVTKADIYYQCMKFISYQALHSPFVFLLGSYLIVTPLVCNTVKLCQGVVANSNRFIKHIVPKMYNPAISDVTQQTEYNRSPSCVLLLQSTDADVCTECKNMEQFENEPKKLTHGNSLLPCISC